MAIQKQQAKSSRDPILEKNPSQKKAVRVAQVVEHEALSSNSSANKKETYLENIGMNQML
jgi:hypothetical protein